MALSLLWCSLYVVLSVMQRWRRAGEAATSGCCLGTLIRQALIRLHRQYRHDMSWNSKRPVSLIDYGDIRENHAGRLAL